jgi:phospholipid/cholesterol/gamma-HCH transport system permease protein
VEERDDRVAVARGADPATVLVSLSGSWRLTDGLPSASAAIQEIEAAPAGRLVFESGQVTAWDSALVTFVRSLAAFAAGRGLQVDTGGLPGGARRLLALALAVPPTQVEPPPVLDDAYTARVGRVALRSWDTARGALGFLGECTLAFHALLRGRARLRWPDLRLAMEQSGHAALGIVALINFLIGAVLAFVGAIQLRQFGATLYVASLVAIGITRELGPLMTGIVMAGRTGASFAALLGTMTVNEEVDALRTLGLKPVEFLALPRIIATTLMLPALVVYADLMGLLGGMLVGVTGLDISPVEYLNQTRDALELHHIFIGMAKSVGFGAVVAGTGCYYGLRCGRSAQGVGEATTRSVVAGIVMVVIVDAIATVLLHAVDL